MGLNLISFRWSNLELVQKFLFLYLLVQKFVFSFIYMIFERNNKQFKSTSLCGQRIVNRREQMSTYFPLFVICTI